VGHPLALLLLLFGAGFLAANLIVLIDAVRYYRLRSRTVLTWRRPLPKPVVLPRAMAVGLGALLFYKMVVLRWPASGVFGEGMMFLYYAVWYPLSFSLERGFYADGIWLERGFVRYADITGITWRDEPWPTLIVVAKHRQRAGHLNVPPDDYAQARRILRDRIAAHDLHMEKPMLDLGGHDEREDV
jgi:hypothetical protein